MVNFIRKSGLSPVQTGPGTHPPSCRVGIGSLSQVLSKWSMVLTVQPHLVPRLKKE